LPGSDGGGGTAAPPDSLPDLPPAQREMVRRLVYLVPAEDELPSDWKPEIGAEVPANVSLHPVPERSGLELLRGCAFFGWEEQAVLVDPATRTIIAVITQ
jgi:hypothetical protein